MGGKKGRLKRDGDGDGKVNCKARRVSRIESQLREFDEAKKARMTRPLYTLSLSLSLSLCVCVSLSIAEHGEQSQQSISKQQTLHESVMMQVSGKK